VQQGRSYRYLPSQCDGACLLVGRNRSGQVCPKADTGWPGGGGGGRRQHSTPRAVAAAMALMGCGSLFSPCGSGLGAISASATLVELRHGCRGELLQLFVCMQQLDHAREAPTRLLEQRLRPGHVSASVETRTAARPCTHETFLFI